MSNPSTAAPSCVSVRAAYAGWILYPAAPPSEGWARDAASALHGASMMADDPDSRAWLSYLSETLTAIRVMS